MYVNELEYDPVSLHDHECILEHSSGLVDFARENVCQLADALIEEVLEKFRHEQLVEVKRQVFIIIKILFRVAIACEFFEDLTYS
jgi:hypothetical protein